MSLLLLRREKHGNIHSSAVPIKVVGARSQKSFQKHWIPTDDETLEL